jgi:hypothetical protein
MTEKEARLLVVISEALRYLVRSQGKAYLVEVDLAEELLNDRRQVIIERHWIED